jgi:hypothetical protein
MERIFSRLQELGTISETIQNRTHRPHRTHRPYRTHKVQYKLQVHNLPEAESFRVIVQMHSLKLPALAQIFLPKTQTVRLKSEFSV